MPTGYKLIDNPNPHKQQYRTSRRATATGAIVAHITLQAPDLNPPDNGAERVANWIATIRDTYGSYHRINDADSTVKMAPWSYETWGSGPKHPDGSGLRSNSIAIHLAIACRHDQWTELPDWWVAGAIDNFAAAAASASKWIEGQRGFKIPARRISLAEFWAGKPGFIAHSEVDPENRKDPGPDFPWNQMLETFSTLTNQPIGGPSVPDNNEVPVITPAWFANMKAIQETLKATGHYQGKIDGKYGRKTAAAFKAFADDRSAARVSLSQARAAMGRLSRAALHAADRSDETAAQLRAAVKAAR